MSFGSFGFAQKDKTSNGNSSAFGGNSIFGNFGSGSFGSSFGSSNTTNTSNNTKYAGFGFQMTNNSNKNNKNNKNSRNNNHNSVNSSNFSTKPPLKKQKCNSKPPLKKQKCHHNSGTFGDISFGFTEKLQDVIIPNNVFKHDGNSQNVKSNKNSKNSKNRKNRSDRPLKSGRSGRSGRYGIDDSTDNSSCNDDYNNNNNNNGSSADSKHSKDSRIINSLNSSKKIFENQANLLEKNGILDMKHFRKVKTDFINEKNRFQDSLQSLEKHHNTLQRAIDTTLHDKQFAVSAYVQMQLGHNQALNELNREIKELEDKLMQKRSIMSELTKQMSARLIEKDRELAAYDKEIETHSCRLKQSKQWLKQANIVNNGLNSSNSDKNGRNGQNGGLLLATEKSMRKIEKMMDDSYLRIIGNCDNWDKGESIQFLKYAITQSVNIIDRRNNYLQCLSKVSNINGKHLKCLNELTLELMGITHEKDRKEILLFVKNNILDSNDDRSVNDMNSKNNNNNNSVDNGDDNGDKCLQCFDISANMVYVACGHRCLCEECFVVWNNDHNNECPVCRTQSANVVKTIASGVA